MKAFVYFIRVSLPMLGILLLMTGCINRAYVGGHCVYSPESIEIVRVKNVTPTFVTYDTYSPITQRHGTAFELPTKGLKVGELFASKVEYIVEGSCTPYIRHILLTPMLVRNSHIFFSSKGEIEAGQEKKIKMLLQNIKEIEEQSGKIELHGYTDKTHSSDYAFSLARGHAEKIKTILMAEGVNEASLVIVSHSNEEAAASSEALPANRVDFAVSFVWPEQKQ